MSEAASEWQLTETPIAVLTLPRPQRRLLNHAATTALH
jgi:hypothetical protein